VNNMMAKEYKAETGVIVATYGEALHIVNGEVGHVDFPEDLIWDIHKKSPGIIYKFAHTHPPEMYQMSKRDEQTLKTWAFAMYPYPVRLSTITWIFNSQTLGCSDSFIETTYFAQLEPRNIWLARKDKAREYSEGEEPWLSRHTNVLLESQKPVNPEDSDWMKIILERSYR